MRQDSSCSWSIGHCSSFVGVLVSIFLRVETPWRLSPLPCPSLSFHCFINVTGACFFPFCVGTHSWVAWICQPWKQSSSRSWMPVVEAPGCLRHPKPPLCEAVVNTIKINLSDFFASHRCKPGRHFFASCLEVNSKGYSEFE